MATQKIDLKLTGQPYVSSFDDTYQAGAKDEKGDYYKIVWEQTEDFINADPNDTLDEAEACDWDKYAIYKDGELLDNSEYELDQSRKNYE